MSPFRAKRYTQVLYKSVWSLGMMTLLKDVSAGVEDASDAVKTVNVLFVAFLPRFQQAPGVAKNLHQAGINSVPKSS